MEDIYLIPIRLKPLNFTIQNIYLKDIYYIYPKEYEEKIGNICIRTYKEKDSNYDVIHIGEVIDKIKEKLSTAHITFLKTDDVVIFFNENKKDIKQVYLPKTCKIEYTRPMIKFKVDGTPYPSGTTIKIIYKDIKKEITIVPISGRVLIKEGKYEV